MVLEKNKTKQKMSRKKNGKGDMISQGNFVSLLIYDFSGSVFNVALKSLPQESCFLFEALIKIPGVLVT